MLKPAAKGEPSAGDETPRELARLHLEVLVGMVCERIWEPGGPSLAEVLKLLPDDPREMAYADILAVLEEVGVAPEAYFFEVSREITRREIRDMERELDELYLRLLAARPPAPDVERPAAHSGRGGIEPIME